MKLGLYLSGCGSLDGSDVPTAVFARELLQARGHDVIAGARDIPQGSVINHRTLTENNSPRNSLDESARITRGAIDDLRNIDRTSLDGLILVGGGGALSTWTDFSERGEDLRITERLKFHLRDVHRRRGPIVCLGNASLPVAFALRKDSSLRFTRGSNPTLRELIERWGHSTTETNPAVDLDTNLAHLSGLLNESHWPTVRRRLQTLFDRMFPPGNEKEKPTR